MSLRQGRYAAVLLLAAIALPAAVAGSPARKAQDFRAANTAEPGRRGLGPGSSGPEVLRIQVLLDRARFSPGEIDGSYGSGTRRAVAGFQKSRGLAEDGRVGPQTWKALAADSRPVLVEYRITAEDVAGPFQPIPEDMMEKAKLPSLSFTSAAEALGEKFHTSPKLLERLNPGVAWGAGTSLLVPSIRDGTPGKAASVIVDESEGAVIAMDAGGRILARYPASVGSERDPLPTGEWKIQGVAKNPPFHYSPDLFWDADPAHAKATVPPGPNNPVGVVWIDLSKDHYGIHGTPEPGLVGRTESHGCIRLTNWDAAELAALVAPGTPAILQP
jgi:lipoprotein-anchoring transpeptidase ErfK/SrfK